MDVAQPGAAATADEAFNERVRNFQEFLQDGYESGRYQGLVAKMIQSGGRRLLVNINHVRQLNSETAEGLLKAPIDYLPAFDKALNDVVKAMWADQRPGEPLGQRKFHVGLEGSFGEHALSPRALSAQHLGTVVCIEGIVTRCSLVRPKVARSVHYCEETRIFHSREYHDGTSLENSVPTGSVYPKEDNEGRPLVTEFGLSLYRDYQTMSIQEMPERSPAGLLPRPTDVILDDDLVDRVKPGDRVRLIGVYRSIGKHAASLSATFKSIILANNITLLEKEIHHPVVTEDDLRKINKIAARSDLFGLLASSVAPSIFGHDYIKKALLLLMLGGIEKNLTNGTHLRGDINMLLIGDPSVGKSQMLRFVLNLAPLAIATTGRGSSGVGLTAAVTQDKETGERTLEAGAMVLADRGVVCIDEFDKMSDIDRVAIHEVMEQQTVTIAKAGIHTSLNARCSVLAAANPAFGSYLDEKKPFENITLPDSLLSRFDLVFVVLDKTDDEFNRAISDHITRIHRFVPEGIEEGAPLSESAMQAMSSSIFGARNSNQAAEVTPVFQRYNEMIHVGVRPTPGTGRRGRAKKEPEILSIPFLKKYIYVAKNMKPVLTKEACDYISRQYAELRSREDGKQDKYRSDAEVAYELLVYALFKEVKAKKRQKRAKVLHADDDDSDSDETVTNEQADVLTNRRTARSSVAGSVTGASASHSTGQSTTHARSSVAGSSRISALVEATLSADTSAMTLDEQASSAPADSQSVASLLASGTPLPKLSVARFDLLRSQLFAIRQRHVDDNIDSQSMMLSDVMDEINMGLPGSQHFDLPEVVSAVKTMSDQNMNVWFQEETESLMFI
nr:MCM DNA helicase complex subunit [Polyrhizophydium stewartii]